MTVTPALIAQTMKTIRQEYTETVLPKWNPREGCIYFEEAWIGHKQPYILPLVILKTHTCRWLQKSGGCAMCNYQFISAFENRINDEDILSQARWALDRLSPIERYPYLHLTSSGSFLDPLEISDQVLTQTLSMLDSAGIETFSTESRPEFLLNIHRLDLIKRSFSRQVTFGIGLESASDHVRNYCLNKGFDTDSFLEAINTVKAYGMSFHSYILLGKPFLSPREDIEDVLRAIRLTLENGGIALVMVANLQPHTLIHWLWQRGKYELPKLWAPLKILELLEPDERERVWIKGLDKGVPTADMYARNCENCTTVIHNALVGWNMTADFSLIEQVRDVCDCRQEWEGHLNDKIDTTVDQRLAQFYEQEWPSIAEQFTAARA